MMMMREREREKDVNTRSRPSRALKYDVGIGNEVVNQVDDVQAGSSWWGPRCE